MVSKVISCSVFLMLTWLGMLILFEKLALKIEGWIWKTPFAHHDSGSADFMHSLSSFWHLQWWPVLWCLDYRVLLDLPNYRSDPLKMFLGVSMEMWGVNLVWRRISRLTKTLTSGGLEVGRNYVRYLVIVFTIFMGLGGLEKREGERGFKGILREQAAKGEK